MRRTVHLLAGIAILGGCRGEQIPTEATARAGSQAAASQSFGADVNKDLATLRRVTASFHQFEAGKAAGWSTKITSCMTGSDPNQAAGGMGFHYGNTSFIDGTASVERPQLLLYEPEKNGKLRLVAVEYIIPYDFHPRSAAPPVLFAHQFQRVDGFGVWGLHAWVWKDNSNGMSANWNPAVNCANTTDILSMSH
jgi:hypothetical protein